MDPVAGLLRRERHGQAPWTARALRPDRPEVRRLVAAGHGTVRGGEVVEQRCEGLRVPQLTGSFGLDREPLHDLGRDALVVAECAQLVEREGPRIDVLVGDCEIARRRAVGSRWHHQPLTDPAMRPEIR
ncbi:MAG: hypothetical protein R6X23_10480 [Acidimicrobiia bacterium]